ncbi:WD40-repeat-containing domain protein [Radiomyces spectabilis]|uniref:WD40-repeat-containing domain protein n=1 Tax=Radiomyces spectabilis TaxID=64574 RepID=UPI00221F28FA|nr:WD40-repeat-containing domain protein [Radiomyces spectabilis]KAI8377735.1 WD40-repeat-containing domain protein [Radiomyces spectabilis]
MKSANKGALKVYPVASADTIINRPTDNYPLANSAIPMGLTKCASDPTWLSLFKKSICMPLSKKHNDHRSSRKRSISADHDLSDLQDRPSKRNCVNDATATHPLFANPCAGNLPSPSPSPVVEIGQNGRKHDRPTYFDPAYLDNAVLHHLPTVISIYDTLPEDMKSYFLFQLMKRSSTETLQFVNSVITPVLKRDYLASLPLELALQVIRYLDVRSLCQAATVSQHWRSLIDSDPDTWRRLLTLDGFKYTSPHMQFTSFHPCPPAENNLIRTAENQHPYKQMYRRQYILKRNWKLGRAKRIQFHGHPGHVVTCLRYDGKKIISGAEDCRINVYDPATGNILRTLTGHDGGVWALQCVGNTLVSGSTDRTVRVWDIEKGKCTHIFRGHTSTVRCLQLALPTMINGRMEPSQPLIITGSRDTTIRIWRLPDLTKEDEESQESTGSDPYHVRTLRGHSHSVRAIATHGNILVSGSYDNSVGVWNLETGRMIHRMEEHTQKVYDVVIDAPRHRCMSGSLDSSVRIWDYETGECLRVLEGHSVLVGLLGLTPNYLVSGAADTTLRIWSPNSGVCNHVLTGHQGAITCFQHDDEKVISGSEGGLKMWDIKTGRLIKDLITGVTGVWRVAFDERRCIAAVHTDNVTSFELLDFGAYGLEETEEQS